MLRRHPFSILHPLSIATSLWQFTVMPFGLCNGPVNFEWPMEIELNRPIENTCSVYLVDIIAIGSNFEEHLDSLETVFQLLKKAI